MKKLIITISVITLLFTLTPSSYALPGEQAIPQATYRVPMGQELEYISKWIQKLNYLREQVDSIKKTMKYDRRNSQLFSLMIGNEDAIDILEDEDFFEGGTTQFNDWLANETYDMFDRTIYEIEETDEETKELWEETAEENISIFMEESTDSTYKELQETSKEEISENDSPNEKDFKKESKELYKKNQKIREENKEELVESEEQDNFIKSHKEEMNKKLENQSAEDFSLKSLNDLMIQNNVISLEILSTMNEIKRQMIQLNSTIQRESINEDFEESKRNNHQ